MGFLTVLTVFLTVCVVGLAVAVFALARQIGVLHERLAPIGVQPGVVGLQVGQALPSLVARTLAEGAFPIGGARGGAMLLMVVSADCPVCKRVIPVARDVASGRGIDLVLVGEGAVPALREMAGRLARDPALAGVPFVTSVELLLLLQIGRLPTLVVLDKRGVIVARDVAATRREVESLVSVLPVVDASAARSFSSVEAVDVAL